MAFPYRRPSIGPCVLAAIALAVATGCGAPAGDAAQAAVPTAPETPRSGGTVVVGSISDVDAWNEYVARQSIAGQVLPRLFARLARERVTAGTGPRTWEGRIAESWRPSDDGLALTFTLREASWSDGAPITAEDVRFTWQAQVHPDVAWAGSASKRSIVDVRIDGPRTVTFLFDRPYPDQLADAVEGGILPKHVFGEVPFDAWRTHDWSRLRVASGPFVLEHHAPGTEIRLAANPRYDLGPPPRIDGVVIRIVPDLSNLVTQVLSGAIDYVEGIAPRETRRLRAAGVGVVDIDRLAYDYIGWNTARSPLDDRRVREALTLAIDREALVEEILYGYGRVSPGPVPTSYWPADPDDRPLPYDPERAARLLSEAGYRPQSGSGLLARDGEPFRVTLATNAGNDVRRAVTVKVQAQLRELGVDVELLPPLEMRAFVQENMAGNFDGYVGGWTFAGKVELEQLFASSAIPDAGYNVVRLRSDAVDAALERLRTARTEAETRAAVREISDAVRAEQPYTFLFERNRLAAVSERLRAVSFEAAGDSFAFLERAWLGDA